ncbi:MAG: hypothetical protein ACTS4V_00165 [Candidatus Hodgkinia cicadicola]
MEAVHIQRKLFVMNAKMYMLLSQQVICIHYYAIACSQILNVQLSWYERGRTSDATQTG